MLKNQPNANLLILNAAVELFAVEGDDKYVSYTKLHQRVIRQCDCVGADRMQFPDFVQCVEKLEDYAFFKCKKVQKDPKQSTVKLAVDLESLESELEQKE